MCKKGENLKLVTFSHPGFTVFFIPIIALVLLVAMQSLITAGNLSLLFLMLKQRLFYFQSMTFGGGIYILNFCILHCCKIDEKYYQEIENVLLKDVKWEKIIWWNFEDTGIIKVDEEGAVTGYTYDKDGQLISMTNAEGYTTTFAYDEMHRVVTMTDARGGVTSYEYNDRGEVIKITDAEGYETSYTYDGNGNTTSMTTPDGVTSYEYDALDRLIKTTSPDGTVETYEYDKLGQMTAFR